MAEPWASWEDFAVRLKREDFTDAEKGQIEAFVADVSELAKVKVPGLDAAIAAGRVTPGILVAFTFQVANRIVSSAGRAGVKSEQYPDWTYTLTDAASRGLYLTDDELAMLAGAAPAAAAAAYSVQLFR